MKDKYNNFIKYINIKGEDSNNNGSFDTKNNPVDDKNIELLDAYSKAVINVVDNVGPAVVSIFVGDHIDNNEFQPVGAGSGVIIAPDGYILTNSHVVSETKNIEVTFFEQEKLKAAVIGDDPETDIAIIKVNASGLSHAVLGDSSSLRVGQLVL